MSTENTRSQKFFFDRHAGGNRMILVYVELSGASFSDALLEFTELARSAGAEILELIQAKRSKPDPKYFIGRGKLEEIHHLLERYKADTVVFNHDLSPSQERNLEEHLKCRVMDRTGLILDIFAQRARTFEGKLQIELAQLKHLSTRLVKGWTHLERQKGGIGMRGGPGETQLEIDRRLIGVRMKVINQRLKKVSEQRHQSRRLRVRSDVPTVSIVGYTNAGKSTLFNVLTHAQVHAADQLFATLDPTLRTIQIPPLGTVILADTVGFIRDLPHELVAAFRATLEETRQSDLLLHVIDVGQSEKESLMAAVEAVLIEIGAEQVPKLQIYNKIDLRPEMKPHVDYDEEGRPIRVWCSATSHQGLDLLQEAILQRLVDSILECDILLPEKSGQLRAKLYESGYVQAEKITELGRIQLTLRIQRKDLDKLLALDGVSLCP